MLINEIYQAFYALRNFVGENSHDAKEIATLAFEDTLALNANENEDILRIEELMDLVYAKDVNNDAEVEHALFVLCDKSKVMRELVEFQEKSEFVCNRLFKTIVATRPGSNVDGMVYTYDRITYEENVVLIFNNGHERKVNVTADSKWAIIKDVMAALE